jgi:hypothetical protein
VLLQERLCRRQLLLVNGVLLVLWSCSSTGACQVWAACMIGRPGSVAAPHTFLCLCLRLCLCSFLDFLCCRSLSPAARRSGAQLTHLLNTSLQRCAHVRHCSHMQGGSQPSPCPTPRTAAVAAAAAAWRPAAPPAVLWHCGGWGSGVVQQRDSSSAVLARRERAVVRCVLLVILLHVCDVGGARVCCVGTLQALCGWLQLSHSCHVLIQIKRDSAKPFTRPPHYHT